MPDQPLHKPATDRPLERRFWTRGRLATFGLAAALVAGVGYVWASSSGGTRLRLDPTRMTTARVEHGEFREYYAFDGRVVPVTTVYLDVEEGGTVEEIFVEGGHPVAKGDLILRFSNANLRRTAIETEARLLENLDILRNTQFNRAQSNLMLRDSLLDIDHKILELQKRYDRYEPLVATSGEVSRELFETTSDELGYLRDKRELLLKRIDREEELSREQLRQTEDSIERVNKSQELLTRIVESLDVRAPISGFLSSIDAEIGQSVPRGKRIGQIDQLDAYKLRLSLDQFYLPRVDVGTPGKFELDGQEYAVEVARVYTEVVNDAVAVDVDFVDHPPQGLRRGQRLNVELSFGAPKQSLMAAKGGFAQAGGRWAYLVSADRRSARRTSIRLGQQNPQYVEVLEGLKDGDWIVTSNYDAFNSVDELTFTQPIELMN
jgi:HlyD family secretion protein